MAGIVRHPSGRRMRCTSAALIAGLLLALLAQSAVASSLCGFPGRDGQGPAAGIVNLWLDAGDGVEVRPGEKQLPVAGQRGHGQLQAGDLLLLIQMQGAAIDSRNSDHYGDGLGAGQGLTALHAGHFELVRVEAASGAVVRVRGDGLNGGLRYHYLNREPGGVDTPGRARWQMVRVPQYEQLTLSDDLRTLPWDGRTGGVLALDVRQQLDLNGHALRATGSGFRGAAALPLVGGLGDMADFRHRAPATDELAVAFGQHAGKGEGLAGTPRWLILNGERLDSRPQADRLSLSDGYPGGSMGRGAPANAGGGANSLRPDNKPPAGGGGGGGGINGDTGRSYRGLAEGGLGGAAVPVSAVRLIAGGGGGAGTRTGSDKGELLPGSGGAGGGIIFLRAGRLRGDGVLDVSAAPVPAAGEGGGGGGGGGTILAQLPFADPGRRDWQLAGAAGAPGEGPGGAGGAGRLLIGGGAAKPASVMPATVPARDDILRTQIAGVAPGYLCRPTGMLLAGLVFDDNGVRGAQAHDGRRQGGERGLGGRRVRVLAATGQRLLAQTETNGAGLFALNLPESLAGQQVSLAISVPAGWQPVAADADDLPLAPFVWQGVHEGEARWQFTVQREYFQDGIRLALIRAPRWETPQARQVSPGSTQLFLFRYLPFTQGRVRFRYHSDPSAAPDWQHRFLIDPQCNEASQYLDQAVSRWLPVVAGVPLCVRVRVDVPDHVAPQGQLGLVLEAETDLGDTPLGTVLPALRSPIVIDLMP